MTRHDKIMFHWAINLTIINRLFVVDRLDDCNGWLLIECDK